MRSDRISFAISFHRRVLLRSRDEQSFKKHVNGKLVAPSHNFIRILTSRVARKLQRLPHQSMEVLPVIRQSSTLVSTATIIIGRDPNTAGFLLSGGARKEQPHLEINSLEQSGEEKNALPDDVR